MNFLKSSLLILCLNFFFFCVNAQAISINEVNVVGNKTISEETILNLAGFKKNNFNIEINDLNEIQKKIFLSNFFSKIDLQINNKKLIITVVENYIIESIIIQGLEELQVQKKNIENNLTLKPNNFFSEYQINQDIIMVKELLSSVGYLRSLVKYEVKKIEDNKVNIFLEVNPGVKFLVKNIYFIGDKKFSSSELYDVVSIREDSFFDFFSSSSIPSLQRINFDINNLKNFYLSEGYYDVQISNSSIDVIDDNYVNVIFSIDSGNKFFIKDLKFSTTLTVDNEKYNNFIKIKINELKNKIYNNNKINQIRNSLISNFEKNGIDVNINYKINKISLDQIEIFFQIEEIVNKKIIANITVQGNDITEEKVIRNYIVFAEGDIYSDLKIKKAKDSLDALGIFKNVKIDTKVNNSKNIDVLINVSEQPSGEISTGVGASNAGFGFKFAVKEKNYLGEGIILDANLDFSTQSVLGNISYQNPDFRGSGNLFSNNFFANKFYYANSGYSNKIYGSNTGFGFDLFENIFFKNGIGLAYDHVTADGTASQLIKSQEGHYLTSKYFYEFFNDLRNKKYKTTDGYTIGAGQEIAFSPSNIPYVQNNFFGSFFKEFSEDYVGTIKYKFKTIDSLISKSVKLSDRVFLKDYELRGFSYRGVGPKVNNDFIGGNYLASSSLSLSVPNGLPDNYRTSTSIFIDIGNVWGSDISGVDDYSKIRSSAGVSLSWFSPIGPLTISFAEPISKLSSDSVEQFSFRLGGVF